MAIDGLNSISTEQLLALQMKSNGQLTQSSSSDSGISESDIAFQSILQNYTDGNKVNTTDGLSSEQLMAMSLMNNGQLSASDEDNSSREMSSQMQYTNALALQAIQKQASNNNSSAATNTIKQQCATGQNLEKLDMVLNAEPINYKAFTTKSNLPAADMNKIIEAVNIASKKYGVDKNLIMAVIKQESNFNSNAVSGAGAAGLMQVMPANFSSVGINNPYDVEQNVNGGTKILKQCLDQYNGDVSMALMAYNAGSGNMQKRGVVSSKDLYKMPQETQNYVPSVLGYYKNGIK